MDDNTLPRLHPAKKNPHRFQPPSKQPPKQSSPETFDLSDSPSPADNNIPKIQVDPPAIEVWNRDDEEHSDEEAAAGAERHFMLSSPMKQNPDSDVGCLSSLVEISDDFNIQDDLIVDEPPKAPPVRGKKRWQMSDLPRGMNDNEAWRKMLIPTVYWHFGNQRDVWMYDDNELASDLGKIISAVYPSSLRQRVTVDGPIFRIVSILFSI